MDQTEHHQSGPPSISDDTFSFSDYINEDPSPEPQNTNSGTNDPITSGPQPSNNLNHTTQQDVNLLPQQSQSPSQRLSVSPPPQQQPVPNGTIAPQQLTITSPSPLLHNTLTWDQFFDFVVLHDEDLLHWDWDYMQSMWEADPDFFLPYLNRRLYGIPIPNSDLEVDASPEQASESSETPQLSNTSQVADTAQVQEAPQAQEPKKLPETPRNQMLPIPGKQWTIYDTSTTSESEETHESVIEEDCQVSPFTPGDNTAPQPFAGLQTIPRQPTRSLELRPEPRSVDSNAPPQESREFVPLLRPDTPTGPYPGYTVRTPESPCPRLRYYGSRFNYQ